MILYLNMLEIKKNFFIIHESYNNLLIQDKNFLEILFYLLKRMMDYIHVILII